MPVNIARITVFGCALLGAACAPAAHQAKHLAHDLAVGAKMSECDGLPLAELVICRERAQVSYRETQQQLEELRRQREQEGEELPDLGSGDRM